MICLPKASQAIFPLRFALGLMRSALGKIAALLDADMPLERCLGALRWLTKRESPAFGIPALRIQLHARRFFRMLCP